LKSPVADQLRLQRMFAPVCALRPPAVRL
jgi:hypothetical protein